MIVHLTEFLSISSSSLGEEIISGAQRIDMPGSLVERAQAGGIDVKKISLNLSGIVIFESFRYCYPDFSRLIKCRKPIMLRA